MRECQTGVGHRWKYMPDELHLSICTCHPPSGAVPIFFAPCRFGRRIPEGTNVKKTCNAYFCGRVCAVGDAGHVLEESSHRTMGEQSTTGDPVPEIPGAAPLCVEERRLRQRELAPCCGAGGAVPRDSTLKILFSTLLHILSTACAS